MTQATPPSLRHPVTGGTASRVLLLGAGLACRCFVGALLYMAATRATEDRCAHALRGPGAQRAIEPVGARDRLCRRPARHGGGVPHPRRAADPPPVPRLCRIARPGEATTRPSKAPATRCTSPTSGATPSSPRCGPTAASIPTATRHSTSSRPAGAPHYTVLTYLEPMRMLADKFGNDLDSRPPVARALAGVARHRQAGRLGPSADHQPADAAHRARHAHAGVPHRRAARPASRSAAAPTSVRSGSASRCRRWCAARSTNWPAPGVQAGAVRATARPAPARCKSMPATRCCSTTTARSSRPASARPNASQYFETVLPVDFNGRQWKAQFRAKKRDLYTDVRPLLPAAGAGDRLCRHHADVRLLLHPVLVAPQRGRTPRAARLGARQRRRPRLHEGPRPALHLRQRHAPPRRWGGRPRTSSAASTRELMDPRQADVYWEQDRAIFERGARQAGQGAFVRPGRRGAPAVDGQGAGHARRRGRPP